MSPRRIPYRVSMYVDDMVLFLSLSDGDPHLTRIIFELFESTSGLACNIAKSQLVPIRCSEEQVQLA
jgi:hypothetical protein